MSRAVRVALLVSIIAVLSGCSDRGKLITLVQRVALTPGVDALDPIDPVPVGQDLRSIEFFLTEPLLQTSAESFDPSVHLSMGGLPLDPANPFSFNTANEGTIPPYSHLTVNLSFGAGGIAEGTYHVSLVSPDANRLKSATVNYLGEFTFVISVVARDGKLPYIVRFTPQQVTEVPEEVPTDLWIAVALFGGGVVPHGERIPPHAPLRAEFSERMRTPLTVGGGPEILVERFFDTPSFGERRVLLPEIIGVDFESAVLPVSWNDTVDGPRSEFATVLTSETVEGLEIATDYLLEFPGAGPLTSMQPAVKDRSGEPLTFRFANDEVARKIAVTDRRGFTTAPIRINTPDHRAYLNINSFLVHELASSAAIGVAPDGTPRIAFFDPDRLTLRYVRRTDAPEVIDVLDLDVNTGHRVKMALDGNGEALVAYADLSNTDGFVDPDPDDEVSLRTSVSIQLVDTRNRNPVVAGEPDGASPCSPNDFETSVITPNDWREIRDHQGGAVRSRFTFLDLARTFGVLQPAPTDQGRRLQAVQGTVAVLSRLLEHGSMTFRGKAVSVGDATPGTVDSSADLLQDPAGNEREVRGIRVPVGTGSVKVVEFEAPADDREIAEIHLAVFEPNKANPDCDPNPSDDAPAVRPMALTSSAIAFDTFNDALVLFGGRDVAGALNSETWELSSAAPGQPKCWFRRGGGPRARAGHVVVDRVVL